MLDYLRLGILYVHLIACCVAIGAILSSDVRMGFALLKGESPGHGSEGLAVTVTAALVILWLTGAVLIGVDAASSGLWKTLSNPKLQAKLMLVTLLTLNGVVLHASILPMLQESGGLLDLGERDRLRAIWAGAISGVSWMAAAFFGIARPLSWKFPIETLLAPYPALVVAVAGALYLMTQWARLVGPGGRNLGRRIARSRWLPYSVDRIGE